MDLIHGFHPGCRSLSHAKHLSIPRAKEDQGPQLGALGGTCDVRASSCVPGPSLAPGVKVSLGNSKPPVTISSIPVSTVTISAVTITAVPVSVISVAFFRVF